MEEFYDNQPVAYIDVSRRTDKKWFDVRVLLTRHYKLHLHYERQRNEGIENEMQDRIESIGLYSAEWMLAKLEKHKCSVQSRRLLRSHLYYCLFSRYSLGNISLKWWRCCGLAQGCVLCSCNYLLEFYSTCIQRVRHLQEKILCKLKTVALNLIWKLPMRGR